MRERYFVVSEEDLLLWVWKNWIVGQWLPYCFHYEGNGSYFGYRDDMCDKLMLLSCSYSLDNQIGNCSLDDYGLIINAPPFPTISLFSPLFIWFVMNALAKARVNLREKSEVKEKRWESNNNDNCLERGSYYSTTNDNHTHGVCPKDAQGIQSLVDLFPCRGIDYGSFLRKWRGTS